MVDTYTKNYDSYLNHNESLLNNRVEPNNAVSYLLGGVSSEEITAEQLPPGIFTAAHLDLELRGWTHDLTFSATDHDTVVWGAGTITLSGGATFSITASNTGNMTAITYIYLDTNVSITALQTTTTAATAVGGGKILIAVAEDVAAGRNATFVIFGGEALGGSGKLMTASDIAANTITANEIYANTITASEISTGVYNLIDENFPSDENLVAYWSLDEGAGLVANDVSGNGYTGDLEAGMVAGDWVAGIAGTCLDFDGSEYVNCGTITNPTTGDFSVGAWVKTSDTGALKMIVSNKDADGNAMYDLRANVSNHAHFTTWNAANNSTGVEGTSDICDGNWHHVMGVRYGTLHQIYVDGVLENTTDSTVRDTTGADRCVIGMYGDLASYGVTGQIDEVRVYSTVITAKEVSALYKNPQGTTGAVIPVGRLISGTIYSKQITMAVVEGAGDSFIAFQKTDFGQDTTQGIIMGFDDSVAANPFKFELTGGAIFIGSGDAIFKADANGICLGDATFADAPFSVDMDGNIVATRISLATEKYFTDMINWSSIDGYVTDGVGVRGEITPSGATLYMLTGDELNDYAFIHQREYYADFVETGKRITVEWILNRHSDLDDAEVYLILSYEVGADITGTVEHIGFRITDRSIYSTSADGTTQETQDTTSDVPDGVSSEWLRMRAVFVPGTDVKFYVDGVLKTTHSTKIPGVINNTFKLKQRVKTTTTAAKYIHTNRVLIEKEY